MTCDRRMFLALAAGAVAYQPAQSWARALSDGGHSAVAFDALAIFDSRPVAALAEALFPGSGVDLMNAWRSRQFEYQWLRVLGRSYVDFQHASEDSLVYAGAQLRLELSQEHRDQLMSAWMHLRIWPDVSEGVRALREAGLRLAILSNMTAAMVNEGIRAARLDTQFEAVLSTDRIRSYKPDPAAYALALDALCLRRKDIVYVAFAGWDVAGAKWFGFPTFWLNRFGSPAEELHAQADASGRDFHSLVEFSRNNRYGRSVPPIR